MEWVGQFLNSSSGWLTLLGLAGLFLLFGFLMMRDRDSSPGKSQVLALYSQDLTTLARLNKLDPVIGRQHEIDRVIQILSRRTKNNAVLVGNSGVGKTAIVEGLANLIAKGEVPDPIKNKRILALDLSGLVAGTKYRGEFEKRLKTILDEVIASKRSIILFIDELHTLAAAGEATGAIDAADILKPALARGELQAVGATTESEYEQYIKHDVTLERRFQPVMVDEPNVAETMSIIRGLRSRYEDHHQVRITDEALSAAVDLSGQALPDRHFPDKAIDVMDEASAKVRLAAMKNPDLYRDQLPTVTADDIREVLDEWVKDLACFAADQAKGRTPEPAAAHRPETGA